MLPSQINSWNNMFSHWEKAESNSETHRIIRARDMVQKALSNNSWFKENNCILGEQGSFTNRTNIREESDIDLRIQHPDIYIEYDNNVNKEHAYATLGYHSSGNDFDDLLNTIKNETLICLKNTFPSKSIEVGNKAIRIHGVDGSRSEVDLVPTFTHHYIYQDINSTSGYNLIKGVSIYQPNNFPLWINNFPEQHIKNGIEKRKNTSHRFKKIVRIIKNLQVYMFEKKIIKKKIPSFLIECLVYNVDSFEFEYDYYDYDDKYSRVLRILRVIKQQINDPSAQQNLLEINEVKYLFHSSQKWNLQDSKSFIQQAINTLE